MSRLGEIVEGVEFEPVDPGFSYADQFGAPSWLETPCEILWNVMQAEMYGELGIALDRLRGFWQALERVKQGARDEQWPEILALDAHSQLLGANILDRMINAMTADASTVSAIMGPLGWSGADAKAAIAYAQQLRAQMLEQGRSMAEQAKTAQAQRVEAVASGRLSQEALQEATENKNLDTILRVNSTLDLGGVPLWAWLAGGVAAIFLLRGR